MPVVRANRTEPLALTDDSINTGVAYAIDFAGDDGVPYVGANAPTKVGTLPLITTSVGANSGRDVSNGGAGGTNQYRWADATKIGIPAGVAAFTIWVRLRTPSSANSSPNIRELVRLTNGTTTCLAINQYELSSGFGGYGVHVLRDGSTALITYSDTGGIIAPDTVYDVHVSRDAAGAFKVYVNGVLRKSGTGFTSDFTIVAGSGVTYFGGAANTKGGVLIDAMTWTRQLSDSEVTTQQADPYSYQVNPDTPTVSLASPATGASVNANIVISGTSNTIGGIEARFNGGAWATIVAAHTGSGTYTGTLTGQSTGAGTLEVRLIGRSTTASVSNITVVSNTLAITTPVALTAIQQAAGVATIPVVVTYTSPTANLEARFNGGAWQSFAVTSSPQTINITGCAIGEGTLDVRMKESIGIAAAVNNIAVCNQFLIIGQSNASGRGNSNNAYATSASHLGMTGRMFANATASAIGVWANLADPVDAGGAGESTGTNDSTSAAGSPWPLLATALIAAGMPAAFIPAAKGGVGVANYAKTNGLDTTTAYGYAASRALAVGAKYALYYQGESDAISGTFNYETQLDTLVTNLWNDCGVITVIGKTHYWSGQSTASIDTIRTAQQNVINSNPYAVAGPDLLGANTGNDIHFLSTAEMQEVANRWYASLNTLNLTQGDLSEAAPAAPASANVQRRRRRTRNRS